VLSWAGYNILGNRDGQVLSDPAVKRAKMATKDSVIAPILGYRPDTRVSIEFVPSLHDWKVAWDHIHFRGFLGTRMSLQFTWQGCDSILAAPLVIDLARLADYHASAGRGGVMAHLACFFKSPMDVAERSLPAQIDLLRRYVTNERSESTEAVESPRRRASNSSARRIGRASRLRKSARAGASDRQS
jgi:myo-inositol-1-phosphate synthase